jgi:hypothetical protein
VGVRVAVGVAVREGRAEPICGGRHPAAVYAVTGHTVGHTAGHTTGHTAGHTARHTTTRHTTTMHAATGHATTGHAGTRSVDVLVHGVVSAEGRCWRGAAMGDGRCHGCHGHACANVGGSAGRRWRGAGGTQRTQGANCTGWTDSASRGSGGVLSALLFESASEALLERRCPAPVG